MCCIVNQIHPPEIEVLQLGTHVGSHRETLLEAFPILRACIYIYTMLLFAVIHFLYLYICTYTVSYIDGLYSCRVCMNLQTDFPQIRRMQETNDRPSVYTYI